MNKFHALANQRYRARKRGESVPLLFPRWTEEECEKVRQSYKLNEGNKGGWLLGLAKSLSRHPANVVRKAIALGCCTKRNRTKPEHLRKHSAIERERKIKFRRSVSEEAKKLERSNRTRERWKILGHPRGMLGKHHTQEVCERMSSSHIGVSLPPWTEERRMKLSRSTVARLQSNPDSFSRKNSRGRYVGRRTDLGGQFFRSRWEANYARFLNFSKIEWTYEKKTFWFLKIKRGVRSYTPDFFIPSLNEFHEVKGWMDAKSQTKLKRMKKYYPDTKVIVVGKEWFAAANRQGMCSLISGWECDHKIHQKSKD